MSNTTQQSPVLVWARVVRLIGFECFIECLAAPKRGVDNCLTYGD